MPAIAFFDLDRTLVACNSATLWLREEIRAGNVSAFAALRALAWIARYSLGAADMERAVLSFIASMRGRGERDVAERTESFYRRRVRPRVRPRGPVVLAEHRSRGETLVLLTSSSKYLAALAAGDLELDAYLCTLLEVGADGCFTGRPVGRPCYGAGKLEAARAYAAGRGVSLSDCAFYTDSMSDLPVLEAVGRPVAVHPDPRLARRARARGWPVVEWGAP